MPTTIASQHRRSRELERFRKAVGDVARDRASGDERATEIAAQHAAGIVRELARKRLVEMQLRAEARDRRGVGAFADHLEHRVAGRDVEEQEGDDDDAGERRDGEEGTASQQRAHSQCAVTVTSVNFWPLKIVGATKPFTHGCTA